MKVAGLQPTEGGESDALAILDLTIKRLVVFTYPLLEHSLWEVLSHHARNSVTLLERPNGEAMKSLQTIYMEEEKLPIVSGPKTDSNFSSPDHHLPIIK